MLPYIKNNTKNNICSNALGSVAMGYNGAISWTFLEEKEKMFSYSWCGIL
jgi:hypothetical protein